MEIVLKNVSKKYGRETIIQDFDRTIRAGSRTAILGHNGSGKSTLLQMLSTSLEPTSGKISHYLDGHELQVEDVYRYVSFSSPYLTLYRDLSLSQAIHFHARFKPFRKGLSVKDVAEIAYLGHALAKPVHQFSSGMEQRLKLALAILSDTPLLLLDEPASNLDMHAVAWYRELLHAHLEGRTLVIASNRQLAEHDVCTEVIDLGQ